MIGEIRAPKHGQPHRWPVRRKRVHFCTPHEFWWGIYSQNTPKFTREIMHRSPTVDITRVFVGKQAHLPTRLPATQARLKCITLSLPAFAPSAFLAVLIFRWPERCTTHYSRLSRRFPLLFPAMISRTRGTCSHDGTNKRTKGKRHRRVNISPALTPLTPSGESSGSCIHFPCGHDTESTNVPLAIEGLKKTYQQIDGNLKRRRFSSQQFRRRSSELCATEHRACVSLERQSSWHAFELDHVRAQHSAHTHTFRTVGLITRRTAILHRTPEARTDEHAAWFARIRPRTKER